MRIQKERRERDFGLRDVPLFFVSVASKGFSFGISLLFATLARRFISVAAKGLTRAMCWRDSNILEWEDLGGVRRTAWRASIAGKVGLNLADLTT
jgi:hypothetical protein